MRKICYLIIGVLLFFSGVVQAGNIIIEPTGHILNLIAGDTVMVPINVTWTGEYAVVGFIITEIIPDGEGITINYSDDILVLFPNEKKCLNMTVDTAINLVPDVYMITTNVFTEIEEIIKYHSGGSGRVVVKYVEVENLARINILLDMIQVLNEELNATNLPITDPKIEELLGAISETMDDLLYQFLSDSIVESAESDSGPLWIIWSMIVTLLIMVMLLFLKFQGQSKKLAKYKEKEKKQNEK